MTAKEFLRQIRTVDRRIEETAERLQRIRARLESGRMSNLTGMPRGGGVDWTEAADRVIELERRLQAQISEMCRQKQAAIEAIDRVEEARLRELLELYYLDGYTWEQVAERMDISDRWALSLHGRALKQVTIPEEFLRSSL